MTIAVWGCLAVCIVAGVSLILGAGLGWWVERQERRRRQRAAERAWRARR